MDVPIQIAQPPSDPAVEAPEAPAEETQPNPLFAEEPDGDEEPSAFDAADEAEEPEGLEAEAEAPAEEPEPDEKKGLPPGLQKRLSQLARQKREARRDADRARNEAAEARARAESLGTFESAVKEHYGRFKDPLRELAMDARRMDALEKFKDVPEVQRVIRMIESEVQKGAPMSHEQNRSEQAAPSAPAIPEPVAALLKQTATTRIEATLDKVGVRPAFRGIMRDHILAAGGDNAAAMDEATILGHAKSYVAKYGLSESDVVEKRQSSEAPKRPPTGKSARASVPERAPESRRAPEKPSGGDEKPKNLTAWQQQHASRRAALLGG